MGKVIERVKLTSLFNPKKSVETEAIIDTGATMIVLPKSLVREPGLEKIEDMKVKYADGRAEKREVYGVVRSITSPNSEHRAKLHLPKSRSLQDFTYPQTAM